MDLGKQVDLLRREIEAMIESLPAEGAIHQMARRALMAPKRALCPDGEIRWSVVPLMVCESICGRCEHAAPAAAAIEFFKVAADVFDDIEDQDSPESIVEICGQAQAINVASGLLALGQKALGRLREKNVDPDTIVAVLEELASSFIKACAGQADDLSRQSQVGVSEKMYFDAVALKSACQLECACRIGALLATTEQRLVDSFGSFGHNLGMAAQITNDIQGILEATGRRCDVCQKRRTLPVIYALTHADRDDRATLEQIYGETTAVTADMERITKAILSRVGAIHYAVLVAELFRQRSLGALEMAGAAGANIERLKAMITL